MRCMMIHQGLVVAILTLMTVVCCHETKIEFTWSKIDYNFPDESIRHEYVKSGDFVQENNVPVGLTVWKDKIFLTVPRWKKGVPANLNYISTTGYSQSPNLTPYPNWKTNDVHSSSNDVIISIFRTRVDACDRLWGVDTGIDDLLGDYKVIRPPRIIVIDLKTNQIIRTYALKDTDQRADSFFADLTVDSDEDSCEDAHAYLSDLGGNGLVVYSWAQNNSWRFHHNYFHFEPLNSDFNITGINFQLHDGLFGLALSPRHPDGSKTLYFHAMAATHEFSVSTNVLKDSRAVDEEYNFHLFNLEGYKGRITQGPSIVMDPDTKILYFSLVNRHGIACWNTKIPLNPRTFDFISQDDDKLAYPNDLTIDPATRKLYVLMTNVPKLMFDQMDPDNKFYVHSIYLDESTHCHLWNE